MKKEKIKEIIIRIQRFNPEKDKKPYFKDYKIPMTRGLTVLDSLYYIRDKIDNTLSFRASCRMGICGSCGMMVNGTPKLACITQVIHLKNPSSIEVKPLPNFIIIKDLVTNFAGFFEKHKNIQPYIIREDEKELEHPTIEFQQTIPELEEYVQFSLCIKCGLCYASCPTVATDEQFLGPQSMTQALRFSLDSRDEGFDSRKKVLDTNHGLWSCHFAGACSFVCPKGVDPALAIQLLKQNLIRRKFGGKPKKAASLVSPTTEKKPKIKPPPYTV